MTGCATCRCVKPGMIVSACRSARSSSARRSARERARRASSIVAAQPQAHVGRDLVVARAAGVQALAGVADERGQAPLDVEVHVLEVARPGELAALDLAPYRAACRARSPRGRRPRGSSDRGEHSRVRERAGDVDVGEAPVEVDGRGVALDELGDRLAEAAGPAPARACSTDRSGLRTLRVGQCLACLTRASSPQ